MKKQITITEGVYRQKYNNKPFRVNIYKEKSTGELCMLVPTWVSEPPELWKKLNND